MSRASREKGARGEREVAAIFRAAGFDCDRVPNSGGLRLKGDLYGTVPVHVEVKRAERWKVPEWLAQSEADAGDATALLAMRRNGGRWYGLVPLVELAELYADRRSLVRGEREGRL